MTSSVKTSVITLAEENIKAVASRTDTVVLFFSCGKDSLALLDIAAPYFKKVVCIFMYFVDNLQHTEKYITWAKSKYTNIEFIKVPHWNLSYILRNGTFCVANPKQKLLTLKDIVQYVKEKTGERYFLFGMKKADSLNRRIMLNGIAGAYISDKGYCYPLADWTNKDVIQFLKVRKLPSPIRYSNNASGGVGFNKECFSYLKDNYPQDLQRIINAFPQSRKILIDIENERDKTE